MSRPSALWGMRTPDRTPDQSLLGTGSDRSIEFGALLAALINEEIREMDDTPSFEKNELLELSQRLLDSIDRGDWDTYAELCDPTLTAFEPEAVGNLVSGMDFHQFYFEDQRTGQRQQSSINNPNVRVMRDTAVVAYIRLIQRAQPGGSFATVAFEETRVWRKHDGPWRHVHFHRSAPA